MNLPKQHRGKAALATVAAGALALSACGGGDDNGNGNGATTDDGKIQLTLSLFGNFGYETLVEEYNSMQDEVHVVLEGAGLGYDGDYRPALDAALQAGSGAGDVVGIEEQALGQYWINPAHWVNLSDYGYDSRESEYLDWKWQLGHGPDGELFGFGTDVGGMAMCYRTDLFEEAGLTTDRDELAAAWSDWDGFVSVAKEFVDADTGAAFLDNATQLHNMILGQFAGQGDGLMYVDGEGNLTLDSPALTQAVDLFLELEEIGAIGAFNSWSEEWFAGMAEGGYAVMPCPGWMAGGVIEPNSGEDNAGKWDLAAAPGKAGNWGGSWLAVPTQSAYPEEAAALAAWLTAPDQQVKVFKEVKNFPSSPQAQDDPEVAGAVSEYFSGAPIGEILAESVRTFPPLIYPDLHHPVKSSVENVLNGVVEGTYSADDVWDVIQTEAENAVALGGM
jgi:cellobiose transport system substrate-binding protein